MTSAQLPTGAVPAFLAIGGVFDSQWRLAVACRDGRIHTIKVGGTLLTESKGSTKEAIFIFLLGHAEGEPEMNRNLTNACCIFFYIVCFCCDVRSLVSCTLGHGRAGLFEAWTNIIGATVRPTR